MNRHFIEEIVMANKFMKIFLTSSKGGHKLKPQLYCSYLIGKNTEV
jgi:hypothetical protein